MTSCWPNGTTPSCWTANASASRTSPASSRSTGSAARAAIETDGALAVGVGFGAGAARAAGLDGARGRARSLGDGVVFADPRSDALGVRALLPEARLAAFFDAAGFAGGGC